MTGSQLKKIRGQLGLTQAEMAERVGVTPNTVARWERGEIVIREPIARLIQSMSQQRRKR
jgi:transcriptional regulator with XRE-family HTH domain